MAASLSAEQYNGGKNDMLGATPSPLGTLFKLPPEIRCDIWIHFMPRPQSTTTTSPDHHRRRCGLNFVPNLQPATAATAAIPTSSSLTRKRRFHGLEILRTSRQIYNEVSAMLYDKELCFTVIRVKVPMSNVVSGAHPFQINGFPHLRIDKFDFLNVAKFKSLRFEIDAPTCEPGFFYPAPSCIQNILSRTCNTMMNGFQNLSIVFPAPSDYCSCSKSEWKFEDFKAVIESFKSMGNVKSLLVQPPTEMSDERVEAAIRSLKICASTTISREHSGVSCKRVILQELSTPTGKPRLVNSRTTPTQGRLLVGSSRFQIARDETRHAEQSDKLF